MDGNKINELLNTILWEQVSSFMQKEEQKKPDMNPFHNLDWYYWVIPIINLYCIFILIPWVWCLVVMARRRRKNLIKIAQKIESTPKDLKLVLGYNNKIGLYYWNNWMDQSLLLYPKFDSIEELGEKAYVTSVEGKYGLYNVETKTFSLQNEYDVIEPLSFDKVKAYKDGMGVKFDIEGNKKWW